MLDLTQKYVTHFEVLIVYETEAKDEDLVGINSTVVT